MREEGSFSRSETLSARDLKFENGSGIFDGWSVVLTAGQTLRVALQTTNLSPQFYILGPLESDTPQILQRGAVASRTDASAEFSPTQAGGVRRRCQIVGRVRSLSTDHELPHEAHRLDL